MKINYIYCPVCDCYINTSTGEIGHPIDSSNIITEWIGNIDLVGFYIKKEKVNHKHKIGEI